MGKTKEHFKKNWKKYVGAAATAAALGGAAYGGKKYVDHTAANAAEAAEAKRKEENPTTKDVVGAYGKLLKSTYVDPAKKAVDKVSNSTGKIQKIAMDYTKGKVGSDLYDATAGESHRKKMAEQDEQIKKQMAANKNVREKAALKGDILKGDDEVNKQAANKNVDEKRALKGDEYGMWPFKKKY